MMRLIPALMLVTAWLALAPVARGQATSYDGRPIAEVKLEGLRHVNPQFALNQIQTKAGEPYDARIVEEDLVRLRHLNKFSNVLHLVELQPDGSVTAIYRFTELPLLTDVQVVGNTVFSDQELLAVTRLAADDPADEFLIDRARKAIVKKYNDAGYFDVSVGEDAALLAESQVLLLRVVEGSLVRIRDIRFEGNSVFSEKELKSRIKSRQYIWLLRKGQFSREQTDDDSATLRQFYRDRGFLDAEVLREVTPSPDGRDALVTFVIKEGEQYHVHSVSIEGNELFSTGSILEAIPLAPGQVYSENYRRQSEQRLIDKYGELGYINARIAVERVFREDQPTQVQVFIMIEEGRPSHVGRILVQGNDVTQDSVVRHLIDGQMPGRLYHGPGLTRTEERIRNSALFSNARVTVLGDLDDQFRDLLIEVQEQNTGSVGFGVGVSSDAGIIGALTLTQRNFDALDFPETFEEFITGKAFRGKGQYFSIEMQPGAETSRFAATFRDPYLFETNLFLDTSVFYFTRERRDYDEERFGGLIGVGQRFGEVWSASVQTQVQQIAIDDIDSDAAIDVFDVEGDSLLTTLGLSVTRNTTDDRIFPTRGSRLVVALERAGALGGDYDFTQLTTRYQKFWTIDEDFFGRRTVLSGRLQAGYIFDEAPLFERFYAGGRGFRGFRYRGVSPRGIRADTLTQGDDPVGGEFLFLAGTEYNFPIYQEMVRGVFFVDTGTVDEDISFSKYRVTAGAGIRLKIPFLGQAPFALDLAFPIVKEAEDDVQYFNFDLAIPF